MRILSYLVTFLFLLVAISIENSDAELSQSQIPPWIKNNAKWWSDGAIGDSDFIKGIQYLVDQGIIQIPKTHSSHNVRNVIPSWVKNTAGWWSSGTIGDSDFIQGMQYLVQENIIQIRNQTFLLTSSEFENNGTIPSKYTCDGDGISPPLTIYGIPQSAKSLALTVVDIDAPKGQFTHWTVWNIPINKTKFYAGENILFSQGMTSSGKIGYQGPCPPSGTHRYVFTLYALDTVLNLDQNTSRSELEQSIVGHVINETVLVGKYFRG